MKETAQNKWEVREEFRNLGPVRYWVVRFGGRVGPYWSRDEAQAEAGRRNDLEPA